MDGSWWHDNRGLFRGCLSLIILGTLPLYLLGIVLWLLSPDPNTPAGPTAFPTFTPLDLDTLPTRDPTNNVGGDDDVPDFLLTLQGTGAPTLTDLPFNQTAPPVVFTTIPDPIVPTGISPPTATFTPLAPTNTPSPTPTITASPLPIEQATQPVLLPATDTPAP